MAKPPREAAGVGLRMASGLGGSYMLGASTFTGEGYAFEVLCEQSGVIAVAATWYVPAAGSSNAKKAISDAIGKTLMESCHRTGSGACAWSAAESVEWFYQPSAAAFLGTIPCGMPVRTGLVEFRP